MSGRAKGLEVSAGLRCSSLGAAMALAAVAVWPAEAACLASPEVLGLPAGHQHQLFSPWQPGGQGCCPGTPGPLPQRKAETGFPPQGAQGEASRTGGHLRHCKSPAAPRSSRWIRILASRVTPGSCQPWVGRPRYPRRPARVTPARTSPTSSSAHWRTARRCGPGWRHTAGRWHGRPFSGHSGRCCPGAPSRNAC